VQSSVLFAVYDAWCKSSGEKAWSARGLSMAMKERGYHSKQSNVMWWLDIKLIRDARDFVDEQGHHGIVVDAKEAMEVRQRPAIPSSDPPILPFLGAWRRVSC
jgi:hypothetical protein